MKKREYDALLVAFENAKDKLECAIKDNQRLKKEYEDSGNYMLAGFHCGAATSEKAELLWINNIIDAFKEMKTNDK